MSWEKFANNFKTFYELGNKVQARMATNEILDEEDFEDYQICDDDDVGWGNQQDEEWQVIGQWDPTMYTNFTKNPFDKEVSDYQKQLKNPQEKPKKVLQDSLITKKFL